MPKISAVFAAIIVANFISPLYAQPTTSMAAVIQLLDRITTNTTKLELTLGAPVRHGTLEITAKSCWQSPEDEKKRDSAALLEIIDYPPEKQPFSVFTGWMFASSPAVSAMEHPVYDIRVLTCKAG